MYYIHISVSSQPILAYSDLLTRVLMWHWPVQTRSDVFCFFMVDFFSICWYTVSMVWQTHKTITTDLPPIEIRWLNFTCVILSLLVFELLLCNKSHGPYFFFSTFSTGQRNGGFLREELIWKYPGDSLLECYQRIRRGRSLLRYNFSLLIAKSVLRNEIIITFKALFTVF